MKRSTILTLLTGLLELTFLAFGFLLGPSFLLGASEPPVQWVSEYTYGPFEIFADFDIEEVRSSMEELYQLDQELCQRFHFPDSEKKVQLYILSDQKRYYDFVRSKFPRAPFRRALFAMEPGAPGQVFLFRHADFAVDLRHECTHALVHLRVDHVPLWLDEGLAEFFEASVQDRLFKEPYFKQIKWNNSLGLYPDLQKLEKIRDMEKFQEKNYRDSWSWVHFLLSRKDTQDCLARYLAACRTLPADATGDCIFPSFKQEVERVRPELKSDYRKYWSLLAKSGNVSANLSPENGGSTESGEPRKAEEGQPSKGPGWNPLKFFGL